MPLGFAWEILASPILGTVGTIVSGQLQKAADKQRAKAAQQEAAAQTQAARAEERIAASRAKQTAISEAQFWSKVKVASIVVLVVGAGALAYTMYKRRKTRLRAKNCGGRRRRYARRRR